VIRERELREGFWKEPVRQKGCVKLAVGRKWREMVTGRVDGGPEVRAWMIEGISATEGRVSKGVMWTWK